MEVICYRGGGGESPENTIEGIAHCVKINPNWRIEIDLRITKDNRIVVVHDDHLQRLAGLDVHVEETNYSDLKDVNIAHHFNKIFGTDLVYQIPLLAEVLKQFTQTKFVLDIHEHNAVAAVVSIIKKFNVLETAIVVSTEDKVIEAVRKSLPRIRVGAATAEVKRLWISSMLRLDALFSLKSDVLIIPASYEGKSVLSQRIIEHARQRNKEVWVYTDSAEDVVSYRLASKRLDMLINDKEKYLFYKNKKVAGVFTDRPGEMMESLEKN